MTAKGWYADPTGRHDHRYWDGSGWSEHASDRGTRIDDPVTGDYAPPVGVPARVVGRTVPYAASRPAGWPILFRRLFAVVLFGCVIAFGFGLFNAGGHVQIGGNGGYVLRGSEVVIGAALLFFGTLGIYSIDWGSKVRVLRLLVSLALIAGAFGVVLGFGRTPQELCGKAVCIRASSSSTTQLPLVLPPPVTVPMVPTVPVVGGCVNYSLDGQQIAGLVDCSQQHSAQILAIVPDPSQCPPATVNVFSNPSNTQSYCMSQ